MLLCAVRFSSRFFAFKSFSSHCITSWWSVSEFRRHVSIKYGSCMNIGNNVCKSLWKNLKSLYGCKISLISQILILSVKHSLRWHQKPQYVIYLCLSMAHEALRLLPTCFSILISLYLCSLPYPFLSIINCWLLSKHTVHFHALVPLYYIPFA